MLGLPKANYLRQFVGAEDAIVTPIFFDAGVDAERILIATRSWADLDAEK
jgi:hypothetical protein